MRKKNNDLNVENLTNEENEKTYEEALEDFMNDKYNDATDFIDFF